MASKQIVAYIKPYRAKIENCKYSCSASIPLTERMDLPQPRHKICDMPNHLISGNTLVAKISFLSDIIVKCSPQVLPVQIIDSVTIQHPLLLSDIIITKFARMFEYILKHTSVDRDISTCTEIQGLRRENFRNIG